VIAYEDYLDDDEVSDGQEEQNPFLADPTDTLDTVDTALPETSSTSPTLDGLPNSDDGDLVETEYDDEYPITGLNNDVLDDDEAEEYNDLAMHDAKVAEAQVDALYGTDDGDLLDKAVERNRAEEATGSKRGFVNEEEEDDERISKIIKTECESV
jgi:hypothetical protein